MSIFEDDRRHPATPTRRQQAREDGDAARSNELAVAIQILAAVIVLWIGLPRVGAWMQSTTATLWSQSSTSFEHESSLHQIQSLAISIVLILLPIMATLFAMSWVANWVQTGIRFGMPKFSPGRALGGSWAQNTFSFSTLALPFVALPKVLLAIGVAAASVWFHRDSFLLLGGLPLDEMCGSMFGLIVQTGFEVAVALLLASVVDYAVQWFRFEGRIRMSDQELRDEMRSQNGDPVIDQQRQRLVRRYARVGSGGGRQPEG